MLQNLCNMLKEIVSQQLRRPGLQSPLNLGRKYS